MLTAVVAAIVGAILTAALTVAGVVYKDEIKRWDPLLTLRWKRWRLAMTEYKIQVCSHTKRPDFVRIARLMFKRDALAKDVAELKVVLRLH